MEETFDHVFKDKQESPTKGAKQRRPEITAGAKTPHLHPHPQEQ